jgi:hypothetical protein
VCSIQFQSLPELFETFLMAYLKTMLMVDIASLYFRTFWIENTSNFYQFELYCKVSFKYVVQKVCPLHFVLYGFIILNIKHLIWPLLSYSVSSVFFMQTLNKISLRFYCFCYCYYCLFHVFDTYFHSPHVKHVVGSFPVKFLQVCRLYDWCYTWDI